MFLKIGGHYVRVDNVKAMYDDGHEIYLDVRHIHFHEGQVSPSETMLRVWGEEAAVLRSYLKQSTEFGPHGSIALSIRSFAPHTTAHLSSPEAEAEHHPQY